LLLDQVEGPLASFTGDGAYDQDSVYRAVIDRALPVPSSCRRAPRPRRARPRRRSRPSATAICNVLPRKVGSDGRRHQATTAQPRRDRHWTILAVLARRPHPEKGFRTCLGVLRLCRGHGRSNGWTACRIDRSAIRLGQTLAPAEGHQVGSSAGDAALRRRRQRTTDRRGDGLGAAHTPRFLATAVGHDPYDARYFCQRLKRGLP
jgi:hypothetical protein